MKIRNYLLKIATSLLFYSTVFAGNATPDPKADPNHTNNLIWSGTQISTLLQTILTAMNKPETNWWATREYMLWWTKSNPSPPLAIAGQPLVSIGPTITTAHIPTAPAFIGLYTVSGTPSTLTIDNASKTLAGHRTDMPPHSGGRFTLGHWLNPEKSMGVEGGFIIFGETAALYHSKNPSLAIPYVDATTGLPSSYPVNQNAVTTVSNVFVNTTTASFIHLYNDTMTDGYAGKFATHTASSFQTADFNAVWRVAFNPDWRPEVFGGIRFFRLSENMKVSSSVFHGHTETIAYDPALVLPFTGYTNTAFSQVTRRDYLAAINNFYGLQLGARGEYQYGRFALQGSLLTGIGAMLEQVHISGQTNYAMTTTTTPTSTFSLAGIPINEPMGAPVRSTISGKTNSGLFAQPSNHGRHKHNTTAAIVMGEVGMNYYITRNLYASAGYTLLYIDTVALPGKQIDKHINPSVLNLPPTTSNPLRPSFHAHRTNFWAQGLNVGINYRF